METFRIRKFEGLKLPVWEGFGGGVEDCLELLSLPITDI